MALPDTAAPDSRSGRRMRLEAPVDSPVDTPVEQLCEELIELWQAIPPAWPALGPRPGWWRQRSTARAARRLMDGLVSEAERVAGKDSEQAEWRESVRQRLYRFGEERLGWPEGYRRLLFGDQFYESAVAFTRDARAFDPHLPLEHIGQALRNVWIGNSLQMLLDRPIELRPGLFAYSMLYPVTDNWLDDPTVSPEAKRSFNVWFAGRLRGSPAPASGDRQLAVARLVTRIENEFPRDRDARVFESLLAIHRAQTRSVRQHEGTRLSDADLLQISVCKGGSSVLADLYLVEPSPEPDEQRFAFGFGVCLQLLDDLQDHEADATAGHETLFTRAVRQGSLDETAARLAACIERVLMTNPRFGTSSYTNRLDLLRRNCLALLVGSVAQYPKRFSRGFRRHLELQWPVSFRQHRNLRRRALRHWAAVQPTVTRRCNEGVPFAPLTAHP